MYGAGIYAPGGPGGGMPGIMCYKNRNKRCQCSRIDINIIACNRLERGNHKEDKHKHNHVQLQPELQNLPHKRAVGWAEEREEPYEPDVEQADVEEWGITAYTACRSMAITSLLDKNIDRRISQKERG